MEAVSLELLALYRKPRPLLEKVEKELMKLKEEYQVVCVCVCEYVLNIILLTEETS